MRALASYYGGSTLRSASQDDTRLKTLVGAVALAKVEQGDFDDRQLRRSLNKALPRSDDRVLFGLAPRA
jgi:hypothetical protein